MSHYWDCRLKGRPPGTPKTDDPNKKKRKRTARERDLCDVKIKITEYLPGYAAVDSTGGFESMPANLHPGVHTLFPVQAGSKQPVGVLGSSPRLPPGHPGANGDRYFTIQRVNGNGANGKNDGISGGHRHTLEESDRIKRNTVQRHFLKEDKERKKSTVCSSASVHKSRVVAYPRRNWLRHSQHLHPESRITALSIYPIYLHLLYKTGSISDSPAVPRHV